MPSNRKADRSTLTEYSDADYTDEAPDERAQRLEEVRQGQRAYKREHKRSFPREAGESETAYEQRMNELRAAHRAYKREQVKGSLRRPARPARPPEHETPHERAQRVEELRQGQRAYVREHKRGLPREAGESETAYEQRMNELKAAHRAYKAYTREQAKGSFQRPAGSGGGAAGGHVGRPVAPQEVRSGYGRDDSHPVPTALVTQQTAYGGEPYSQRWDERTQGYERYPEETLPFDVGPLPSGEQLVAASQTFFGPAAGSYAGFDPNPSDNQSAAFARDPFVSASPAQMFAPQGHVFPPQGQGQRPGYGSQSGAGYYHPVNPVGGGASAYSRPGTDASPRPRPSRTHDAYPLGGYSASQQPPSRQRKG